MTEQLRSALGADADTPAGVDLGAVRGRARSLRRRRTTLVAGAAAAVAVAAIVVPAGILGGGGAGPDTGPAAAPAGTAARLACPGAFPARPVNTGAGLADRIVPFEADEGLVCAYSELDQAGEGLAGVLTLTVPEARSAAERLNAGRAATGDTVCTSDFGPEAVLVAGDGAGRTVTIAMQSYGCGSVTNGTLTLSAKPVARELALRALKTTDCDTWSLAEVANGSAELLPADTRRLLICGGATGRPTIGVDEETTRSLVARANASKVLRRAACPGSVPQVRVFALAGDRVAVAGVSRECGVVGNGLSSADDGVVDQLIKASRRR